MADEQATKTSIEQFQCLESCKMCLSVENIVSPDQRAVLKQQGLFDADFNVRLMREKHVVYLRASIRQLNRNFITLDASRPWLCYWMLQGLNLLDADPSDLFSDCIDTLKRFQAPNGGFGGNISQIPHAATTYASCLSLAIIGTPDAYEIVDRAALYRFFWSMKDPTTGAFRAHDAGEVDVRVTYCMIAIASLYNILTPELSAGVAEYALSCQTYEGGFGGEPHNEAHGGYAFCAVAVLSILKALDRVDLVALTHWIANRQMVEEGGYQGRTNKLVDGCYSFWQGAVPLMIAEFTGSKPLCNSVHLQKYILFCGQQHEGGLRDKPGKPRDHYHSCYCLSGLSLAQQMSDPPTIYGAPSNQLRKTHPVYNVARDRVERIQNYFKDRPLTHEI